ncbi:MAG: hypothetical protein ACFFDP_00275 [Promethearchaeota archaeon]
MTTGLGEDVEMKLGEVAYRVVDFLREHPEREYTTNTLLLQIGLPLREKRRLYDVIEVLSCTGLLDIRSESHKRYFQWKASYPVEQEESLEVDLPENPAFREAGTILHVLLKFGVNAFQELSNKDALRMIERDIKRNTQGANAVSVIRVILKNERGNILKEATTPSTIPAVTP